MANSVLTVTAVTREALRIAHEMLSFIGTVKRDYDDSYKMGGAKRGDTLKIRLPNEYTVRTGKTLNAQDTTENSVSLVTSIQKGVDISFSSQELTLEMQDFSERILRPAMAVLVSDIESSMLSYVTKKVYNHVGTPGTLPTFLQINQAKAKLNKDLAPKDGNRYIQVESVDMAGIVNEIKGLFHDSKEIAKQYREGMIGRGAGLDWYENERVYTHTTGSDFTTVTVNDTPAEDDSTLTVAGGNFKAGDIFTFAGVKAVHPETKVAYAHEKQFVVTADGTTSLAFDPPLRASGPRQNIDHLPSNSDAITFVGTASTAYPNHLTYHKDAFAFTTADLEMPNGVDFAAREVYDGLSLRIVRQYDINNDNLPCRIDILHGYEAIRPAWACRTMGKGS